MNRRDPHRPANLDRAPAWVVVALACAMLIAVAATVAAPMQALFEGLR